MTRHVESGAVILIFTKAPEPGHAKTRLIPVLGAQGAARLQERMTRHVVDTACRARVGDVQLWCAPSAHHPSFVELKAYGEISFRDQRGDTLGERLRQGHDAAFEGYDRVLLIGTDCPALTETALRAAASGLVRHDALIIPAEDGGYVLLGLSCPCPKVFEGIDWGSDQVLRQTLERLQDRRRTVLVYEPLWDVDRPEDLERLRHHMPQFVDGA